MTVTCEACGAEYPQGSDQVTYVHQVWLCADPDECAGIL